MPHYLAHFDFTTAHKNGKFVGRSGQLGFTTEDSLEEVNKNRGIVEHLCIEFIHSQKPKWNVLMITVKDIIQNKN